MCRAILNPHNESFAVSHLIFSVIHARVLCKNQIELPMLFRQFILLTSRRITKFDDNIIAQKVY